MDIHTLCLVKLYTHTNVCAGLYKNSISTKVFLFFKIFLLISREMKTSVVDFHKLDATEVKVTSSQSPQPGRAS